MDAAVTRRRQRLSDHVKLLRREFDDQAAHVVSLVEQMPDAATVDVVFPPNRFSASLANALYAAGKETADEFGQVQAQELASTSWNPMRADRYLQVTALVTAQSINSGTRTDLVSALRVPVEHRVEAVREVFDRLRAGRLDQWARSHMAMAANFGAYEAAQQAFASHKTWRASEDSERHAEMDGQRVRLAQRFGNGLRFPADPTGDVDEIARCECWLTFE